MKKLKTKLFTVLLLASIGTYAQVGIGTTTPQSTLDITATSLTGTSVDGLLIPRVSRLRAQTMTGTPTSTMIYVDDISNGSATLTTINVTSVGYYYFDGTVWIKLTTGNDNDSWKISGNNGTNPSTNFIGTTDNQDFVIRRNNFRAGYIGDPIFTPVTFVFNNSNTSFGANSLVNPTINVGSQTGIRNTAFGANTMPSLTSGRRNTGFGESVLFSNISGSENTAVGVGALYANTNANANVAIGRNALTNSNANNNTAVGFTSLRDNLTGTGNSALGYRSLQTSTGSNNTAIGFDAGFALTTGSNNIMIGANTVAPVASGSDQLNIGNTIYGSVGATKNIGISQPNPQGILDITSTNDGLLIPRVALTTTTSALPLTLPTISELVYNTANVSDVTSGFYYWNGTIWVRLATGVTTNDWTTTGNAGLSGTTNFMGTTDDVDVSFRRNNIASGKIQSTNTSLGVGALNIATTGTNNAAFGTSSLGANTTGSSNVAIGTSALTANSTASNNTAVGASALAANTTGQNNTAIGQRALVTNILGGSNTAIGTNALAVNTASDNTAVGFSALTANTIGTKNTALGTQASSSITSGTSNTAVGYQAQTSNTAGSSNVAIGERALGRNSGSSNTVVGFEAMWGTTSTSSNSTAIGWHALFSNSGNNNTAIGYDALQGNTNALGNTAVGSSTLRINTGANNTAMGTLAGDEHGSGANNTYVGFEAGRYNTGAANNNAFFGHQAGLRTTGSFNTAIGSNSLLVFGASANNVAVGYNALRNNTGTGNVALGYQAGLNETTSNKLYIENSNANADAALIYGEFDNNIVRINGTLQISNPAAAPGYSLPNVRGTVGQVLQTNGAGTTSWVNASTLAIAEVDPKVQTTTINTISKWNGTGLVNSIIQDDGTNVGIGIPPSAGNKLEIAGKTRTTDFQMTNGAAANYIMQSDATGNASWVQNPVNTYSYTKVNLSANQSLTTSNWQKINFDSEVIDTNSEFAGGTFTASKAGLYQVNASFHTNDQSNQEFYSIGVYVNGVLYQQMTGNHSNLGPVFRNISCAVNLAIGGTIEIFAENYQTSVNVDAFPAKTFFEIIQIR
ncbi:beta strand repeat-containing protein [Flavobacterium dankookense]|uniref:C1q domain-containing protein n=1 Tax=Flavobacterium dankookense TaxID=706186 RepID=A0A4R6QGN4_9FLAO|nr:hypothetical protein [Flavobacterium dankookense]TDP61760.1 hypothetical protein BC748_0176 [Flavobacterium dankookense]